MQAYRGTKVHDSKDPASDLGPMFQQVISTLFYLMWKYQRNWQHENPVQLVPLTNEAPRPKGRGIRRGRAVGPHGVADKPLPAP